MKADYLRETGGFESDGANNTLNSTKDYFEEIPGA